MNTKFNPSLRHDTEQEQKEARGMMRKLDKIFERDPVPSLCEALIEVGCPCSKCGSKRLAEDGKGIFCEDCKNYLALKCNDGKHKISLETSLGLMRK